MTADVRAITKININEFVALISAASSGMTIQRVGIYSGSILYIRFAALSTYTDSTSLEVSIWRGDWIIELLDKQIFDSASITREIAESNVFSALNGRELSDVIFSERDKNAVHILLSGAVRIRITEDNTSDNDSDIDVSFHLPDGRVISVKKEYLPNV